MYSPLAEDNEYIKCTLDDLIYRYGEVLLNYAEAKAELGECDQAVLDKTINKLRDRVGMKHLTTDVGFTDPNWPNWEVPISPLLNEIRRERRVELALESERFFDLVRWGEAAEVLNKFYAEEAADCTIYTNASFTKNKNEYLPIPFAQMSASNGNYTQNCGNW